MIQNQVLNEILQNKDSNIIILNNLTSEYFSDYVNEFNFIKNHLNQYSVIPDIETFLNVFPDFDIISVNEPTSFLLEELMKDRNKRFAAETYNKARKLLLEDRIDEAMQVLRNAAQISTSFVAMQAVDLITDRSRYDTYIDMVDNPDKYFITTGFKELDKILGGWNTQEDVATIVARNGLGKSWVLFKCAAAAAQAGKRVGVYSGEMSEDSVGFRVDSIIQHISNGSLVHGSASVKNQYKNYLDNLENLVPGHLFVLTPKQINGPATISTFRAFVEKYNLDILFIDQHSLIIDERGAKNPIEQAANISTDIKLLQTTKRIPVISVSQQNREKVEGSNGEKSFDTTQVARSDKIAQDSSVVIFIERTEDLMKLHLVKSRQTTSGNILTYKIDLNQGEWIYIPDEKSVVEESDIEDLGYNGDEIF